MQGSNFPFSFRFSMELISHNETRKVIERDNLRDLKSKFGYKYPTSLDFSIPNFPHISLQLLKSLHDPHDIKLLIKNAAEAPHLFDAFFKHLALNVYRVKRDDLVLIIAKHYPKNINLPRHLDVYQNFIRRAIHHAGCNALFYFFMPIACIYKCFLSDMRLSLSFATFTLFFLDHVEHRVYQGKYERFEKCDAEMLKSFYLYVKVMDFTYLEE